MTERSIFGGHGQFMRDYERSIGATLLAPGDVDWLPTADWHPATIVSTKGKEVRLVALLANRPFSGAFKRLLTRLVDQKLRPVVVCPIGPFMPAIMEKWRWTWRRAGNGQLGYAEYRPPKGWRP